MSMFIVVKASRLARYLSPPLFALLLLFVALRVSYAATAEPAFAGAANAAVLVIDAGHGGADGGAVATDGVPESGINLDIALKMQSLAGFCGVSTAMTRQSEEIDYPDGADTIAAKKKADQRARVELINSIDNAVLICIHQNKYPDPRPRGAQALYAATEGSRELGELTHANLLTLYPENRRVAAPISDSIYLMKNVKCPAVLVECGFLSNSGEAALLETDTYQLKLAVVILSSFLEYERGLP